MIVVAGTLTVEPEGRQAYLDDCVAVVTAARRAPGCLDFALSADLLDPARINVLEVWATDEDLRRFRGEGPTDDQQAAVIDATVRQYTVTD